METFLSIIILGLFTFSAINAVEGLKCRQGSFSDSGEEHSFSNNVCGPEYDQCLEVIFEEPGCQYSNDRGRTTVLKSCVRAENECGNYPRGCKVANCSLCREDLCNRKFVDGPMCQEGFKYASGHESFEETVCQSSQQCFAAIFAKPCVSRGSNKQIVSVEKGCVEANWTCENAKREFPGCQVAACSVCQDDMCNTETPQSSGGIATSTSFGILLLLITQLLIPLRCFG